MADADKSMSKSVENVREKPGQLKDWQIRQKWLRLELNCGSRYPPFCIEPLPLERQRLSGAGMSDKDRALRRQWVKDQILSPDEPREVPALRPYNIFRRIYRAPANFIFSSLTPMIVRRISNMKQLMLILIVLEYLKHNHIIVYFIMDIAKRLFLPTRSVQFVLLHMLK